MEAKVNIKIHTEQLIQILKQLDINERVSILKEFASEWKTILGIEEYTSMKIDEYTDKLEQGLKDYRQNKILTHNQMKEEMEKWKKEIQ